MLWAAGEAAPKKIFGHGFVYIKNEESGLVEKIGKSLGNVIEPLQIVQKFNSESFRYFFLRECPFPADGEFGWQRFVDVFNAELANNLGNLLSRVITIPAKNFDRTLPGTAGQIPESTVPGLNLTEFVATIRSHVEAFRYNQALQMIVLDFLTPTNQYLETHAPWKTVKTDREAAKKVLFNAAQTLRVASILLKPFIPQAARTIYHSFNFPDPWESVSYQDAATLKPQAENLHVRAELVDGKIKPLFLKIQDAK